jgi:O-succinylbenzoic acid--CoA ligase
MDPDLTEEKRTMRIERIGPDLLIRERTSESNVDGRSLLVSRPDMGHGADDAPQRELALSVPTEPPRSSANHSSESAEPPETEPAELGRDDTVLVLFTSGTTGDPKGVRLTLGNLLASATASAFRLGVAPDDRWLDCLPPYHMGGLAPIFRMALYGTTLVLQPSFGAETTARVIDEYDVTGVSLVPTQLTRMLDAGWSPSAALDTVLLGGAPASRELLQRALDRSVPVCPTYGLTETASQVATALPETASDHPASVGQPLVCTDVTILDDSEPVDGTETGELVVDGPTVTPGYLDDERTEQAFCAHGLRTGDVGWRDEAGRLYILGRRDELIQSGGELVAPAEVAEALEAHESVQDAAVVGVDDEEWGERVAALVVTDGTVAPDALDDYCRERLVGFKRPKEIVLTDAIPRTQSGTVDRGAVRKIIGESESV